MKEKTFRVPDVREVLEYNQIEIPEKISERFILQLINSGKLRFVKDNYEKAVEVIENLDDNIALLGENFRISGEESNYGIKSLERLVKIDSQKVLEEVTGGRATKLTRQVAEEFRIWPYTLLKLSFKDSDPEKPYLGFYWIGFDRHPKANTWIRCATSAEMEQMKEQGDFFGRVIDSKPYGRNLRVEVSSRTEEGAEYKFTLSRLPMNKRGDKRQFSDWINLSHNSSDPDASYRGEEHEKRVNPVVFWSASTIFGFYEAMKFVKQHKEWRQFRINPFPIPTNKESIDFIDNLRLRSLMLIKNEGKLHLEVLNKTTMDGFIGARTSLRGYDNCWHHWGKKDLSYLYTP